MFLFRTLHVYDLFSFPFSLGTESEHKETFRTNGRTNNSKHPLYTYFSCKHFKHFETSMFCASFFRPQSVEETPSRTFCFILFYVCSSNLLLFYWGFHSFLRFPMCFLMFAAFSTPGLFFWACPLRKYLSPDVLSTCISHRVRRLKGNTGGRHGGRGKSHASRTALHRYAIGLALVVSMMSTRG